MDFAFAPKIKLNAIEKESRHGTQLTFTTFKIVQPLPGGDIYTGFGG